ncbi:MAG: V-type ATP synthase subunit K [Christensenellaceae bacterium]|jgi:V/A-type H+-transporting ATPase subunit K|nr:V-type ATP synthase subunit K [Christensenellaceae bacterium]
MDGNTLALIGAALAVALAGAGSAFGVSFVQQASCGVITEYPEKYNKTLVLQLVPASQALYGFVVGFLVLTKVVLTNTATYTPIEGGMVMGACLAVGIAGLFSGLAQGKVCASGVIMIGKREEMLGRALTMAVVPELFALFGLIVSILTVLLIEPTGPSIIDEIYNVAAGA